MLQPNRGGRERSDDRIAGAILLGQGSNPSHHVLGNRPSRNPLRQVRRYAVVHQLSEMNPDSGTLSPSAPQLMAQVVGESRDEDRNELGPSLENQMANARVCGEEGVGILALVASPFRVEANQPASSLSAQVSKNPKGMLIETASAGGVKERRVHRPPGTDEVDQDAEGRLIKKSAPHREVDVPPPARP